MQQGNIQPIRSVTCLWLFRRAPAMPRAAGTCWRFGSSHIVVRRRGPATGRRVARRCVIGHCRGCVLWRRRWEGGGPCCGEVLSWRGKKRLGTSDTGGAAGRQRPFLPASGRGSGAWGERRCFGRVSEDVSPERRASSKRACSSDGEKLIDHGVTKAVTHAARWEAAALRARARASNRKKFRHSSDHRLQDRGQLGDTDGRRRTQVGTLFGHARLSQGRPSGAAMRAPGHAGRSN